MPDTAPQNRKFESLEVGRFIAAALVVLFHVNVTTMQGKYLGYQVFPIFAGGFAGVEFFFVLSGFVIAHAHRRDFAMGTGSRSFLYKRFKRLFPAYWATILPLSALMIVAPQLQWGGELRWYDFVAGALLVPIGQERILAVAWTLRYELIFYGIFAVTLFNRKFGLLLAAIWIGASLLSFVVDVDGVLMYLMSPFPLMFLAGVAISLLAQSRSALPLFRPAIAIGLLIAGFQFAVCASVPFKTGATFTDSVVFGAAAAFIIYGLVGLELNRHVRMPSVALYLGRASYSIYLVHFPLVSISSKIAVELSGVPDSVVFLGITAISIAGGVVFYEVVERQIVAAIFHRLEARRSTKS